VKIAVVESPFFTEDTEVDTAHQALVLYFLSLAEARWIAMVIEPYFSQW